MFKKSCKVIVFSGLLMGSFFHTGLHAIDCNKQYGVCSNKCNQLDWVNKCSQEVQRDACLLGCFESSEYCKGNNTTVNRRH